MRSQISHSPPAATIPPIGQATDQPPSSSVSSHFRPSISAPPEIEHGNIRIQLWDLPLRIFHWSLVVAVLTAFVTANIGGNWMELHGKAGIAILGLLGFRFTWGVIGSTHARFLNFAPTPSKLRTYLKGQWQGAGHNPLGAISVFALLILLTVQSVSGLFSNDDISFNGPLFSLISAELSTRLTGLHHQISNFLLIVLGLHIAAIAFYVLYKKNNLVKPMVTGWKEGRPEQSANKTSRIALIVALLIAFTFMYLGSGAGLKNETPAPAATKAKDSAPAW